MQRKLILTWMCSFFNGVRLSRIKTMAALVEAMLKVEAVAVTTVGREVLGVSKARYGIKRLDRFLANLGIEIRLIQRSIARSLAKRSKKTWLIALDWTSLAKDKFTLLTASIIVRGRSIPIFWITVSSKELKNRKALLVRTALRQLKQIIPETKRAIILADRQFGNSVMVRCVSDYKFYFVLRCRANIYVKSAQFRGNFYNLNVHSGRIRVLREANLTRGKPTTVTAVATWQRCQKEPWYLVTNLERRPTEAISLYGKRFRIEESFRDKKEMRFGLKLNALSLKSAERFDRMLLLIVLSYIIWLAVGEWAVQTGRYRDIQTNSTVRRTLSIFRLGRYFLLRNVIYLCQVFHFLAISIDENWG